MLIFIYAMIIGYTKLHKDQKLYKDQMKMMAS